MKLTGSFKEQHILDQLQELPADRFVGEYRSGQQFMKRLQLIIDAKNKEYNETIRVKELAVRLKKAANTIKWEPLMIGWAKKNLKVGHVVKMKGCRDGHGMREIIHVNSREVECHQLKAHRGSYRNKGKRSFNVQMEDGNLRYAGVTQHMWNKVTHLADVDEDGEYVLRSIKEFVKAEIAA